jgi:hypothetical protein
MLNTWLKLFGISILFKWILFRLFKIFYPFKIAAPKNLKQLAGTNWAGIALFK